MDEYFDLFGRMVYFHGHLVQTFFLWRSRFFLLPEQFYLVSQCLHFGRDFGPLFPGEFAPPSNVFVLLNE